VRGVDGVQAGPRADLAGQQRIIETVKGMLD
jgi:hypothetical protein